MQTLGEERLVEIGDVIEVTGDIAPTKGPTSGADITDFRNISDSVGQLYSYYYSNNSVVLGTRSATNTTDSDMYRIQMAIGVSSTSDGEYVCTAKSSVNGTSNIILRIKAVKCKSENHIQG